MTYDRHFWNSGPAGGTLVTAAKLNEMEQGIADASPAVIAAAVAAATATVEFKTSVGGVRYSVTRVHTHGQFLPGIVSKEYAFDYQTVGTTGAAFAPPREDVAAAQVRLGVSAIFNSSGWETTPVPDEIVGAQIRNGVIYHEMTTAPKRGSDSLGFFADGSSQIFSKVAFGDTAASMLAAGVVDAFSFGPRILVAGAPMDYMADAAYATSYQTELSARQVLGQSATGDIIVISTEGVTGVSGIAAIDVPALAAAEGCYNAIFLDGGGSVQSMVNGVPSHVSSDSTRKRAVPDFLVLNTRSSSRAFDTGWIPLVLEAGYEANGEVPAIRQAGLGIEFRGQVKPTTGVFGATTVTIAKIPARFLTGDAVKVFIGNGSGTAWRKLLMNTNGDLAVTGDPVDGAYVTLHAVRYSLG